MALHSLVAFFEKLTVSTLQEDIYLQTVSGSVMVRIKYTANILVVGITVILCV